jgi:hypothetical protein
MPRPGPDERDALLDAEGQSVWRLIVRILGDDGDDAADCFQQAFVELASRQKRSNDVRKVGSLLRRIAAVRAGSLGGSVPRLGDFRGGGRWLRLRLRVLGRNGRAGGREDRDREPGDQPRAPGGRQWSVRLGERERDAADQFVDHGPAEAPQEAA